MKEPVMRMQLSARMRALAVSMLIVQALVSAVPAGAAPKSKPGPGPHPTQAQADLGIRMIDWANHVAVGEEFTYWMRIQSSGPDATSATFENPLPPELSLISAYSSLGACSGDSTVSCDLGTIEHYGEIDVFMTVRAESEGTIVNRGSVTSQSDDPNTSNNSTEATTQIERHQDSTGTACSGDLKWLSRGSSGGTCILVGGGGTVSVFGAAADPVPLGSWPYYLPPSFQIEVEVTTLDGAVVASCTGGTAGGGACTGTSPHVVEAGTPLVCRAITWGPIDQTVVGRFGCIAGS